MGRKGTFGALPRFFGYEIARPRFALRLRFPSAGFCQSFLHMAAARLVKSRGLHNSRAYGLSRYLLVVSKSHRTPCTRGPFHLNVRHFLGPLDSRSRRMAESIATRQSFHLTCFLPVQQQLPVDIGDCPRGQRRLCRSIRQRLYVAPCPESRGTRSARRPRNAIHSHVLVRLSVSLHERLSFRCA